MSPIFEAASKVSNEWSLLAFAIAALLVTLIVITASRKRKVPKIAWAIVLAFAFLGAIPFAVRAWMNERGIYRVRVIVLDLQKVPVNDAKITSSSGGEPKRVEGGWQFDIPAATRPSDHIVTFYAVVDSAFLRGQGQLRLANDFHPTITISLIQDVSARVRGRVADISGNALSGVSVGVVGRESEVVSTGPTGNFDLPAHKADGQQVQLYAQKAGYKGVTQWTPAGESPVTIVLEKYRRPH